MSAVMMDTILDLAQIDLRAALDKLADYVKVSHPSFHADVVALQRRERTNSGDYNLGLLTKEEHDVTNARIFKAITELKIRLGESRQESTSDSPTTEAALVHQYTCNRDEQRDRFFEVYQQRLISSPNTVQFYYLFGDEYDSLDGFVRRLKFELEGNKIGENAGRSDAQTDVEYLDFYFSMKRDLKSVLLNLKQELFNRFEVNPNNPDLAPLQEKDFNYLLGISPLVARHDNNDLIIIHIVISELEWDEELVPEALKIFQESFISGDLDARFPKFLFFISFEFDEEGEDMQEVLSLQASEKEIVEELPLMNKIRLQDIKRWFKRYAFLFTDPRSRKEKQADSFGEDNQKEFDMDDVQQKLLHIIREYNNSRL